MRQYCRSGTASESLTAGSPCRPGWRSVGHSSIPNRKLLTLTALSGQHERTVRSPGPLCQSTLADFERVFGPDHPNTLKSRSNPADVYVSVGDLSRAIELYKTTLADAERVLGSDHPTTRRIRSNLDKVRSI
jgi:hypothetical protein